MTLAALAGCVGPRRQAPPPVAPPPPAVERPVEAGPLPVDAARHRVAMLVPVTGANAAVGQSLANAANLALLDTKAATLRMTVYDTAGVGGPAAAAQRAIAEGNRLFLGPLLGEEVRAVAPVARAARVPVLAFSNDAAASAQGVYLLGFSPIDSVERVVRYAAGRGVRRVAALIPAGVYGRRASTALVHAAGEAKVTVAAIAEYDRATQSLAAAAQKLGAAGGYDAILVADSGRIVLQAIPLVRKTGSPQARVLGTELWNTEPSLARSPLLAGAWFASVSDGLYGQFAAKYRARFGRGPYRLSTLGYDAVLLTVRASADWKVGDVFPADMLTDRDGFTGVDGAFRFARDGLAERSLEVKQVGPSGFTVIAPASRRFDGR